MIYASLIAYMRGKLIKVAFAGMQDIHLNKDHIANILIGSYEISLKLVQRFDVWVYQIDTQSYLIHQLQIA